MTYIVMKLDKNEVLISNNHLLSTRSILGKILIIKALKFKTSHCSVQGGSFRFFFKNVCPFDCMTFVRKGEGWSPIPVNYSSYVDVITNTDRPKSVCNRSVTDHFGGVFVFSLCSFGFSLVKGISLWDWVGSLPLYFFRVHTYSAMNSNGNMAQIRYSILQKMLVFRAWLDTFFHFQRQFFFLLTVIEEW